MAASGSAVLSPGLASLGTMPFALRISVISLPSIRDLCQVYETS
jgi:hypothetical protein